VQWVAQRQRAGQTLLLVRPIVIGPARRRNFPLRLVRTIDWAWSVGSYRGILWCRSSGLLLKSHLRLHPSVHLSAGGAPAGRNGSTAVRGRAARKPMEIRRATHRIGVKWG
jgi:hypothetical protein